MPFTHRRGSTAACTRAAFVLVLFAALAALPARAQSEMFVDVMRVADLEYGAVVQGMGPLTRTKADPYIAVFKVSARLPASSPQVMVTLFPPSELDGSGNPTVPYDMEAAYNVDANSPEGAVEMNGSSATFTPQIEEGPGGARSAYVYVYGTVDVGHQPAGHYEADVTLTAQQAYPDEPEPSCDAPAWVAGQFYPTGEYVTHNGYLWISTADNEGNLHLPPDHLDNQGHWDRVKACNLVACNGEEYPQWISDIQYQDGEWVYYADYAWRAAYNTSYQVPSNTANSPWERMGPCDGTPWHGTGCDALQWTPTKFYYTGDQVRHDGWVWRAKGSGERGHEPGPNTSWFWEKLRRCSSGSG